MHFLLKNDVSVESCGVIEHDFIKLIYKSATSVGKTARACEWNRL